MNAVLAEAIERPSNRVEPTRKAARLTRDVGPPRHVTGWCTSPLRFHTKPYQEGAFAVIRAVADGKQRGPACDIRSESQMMCLDFLKIR